MTDRCPQKGADHVNSSTRPFSSPGLSGSRGEGPGAREAIQSMLETMGGIVSPALYAGKSSLLSSSISVNNRKNVSNFSSRLDDRDCYLEISNPESPAH